MPRIDNSRIRKLKERDSLDAIGFIDGLVTKAEAAGDHDIRITVGEENFLTNKENAEKFNMHVGKHIRGFLMEYSIPDDGCTIFYFRDFHPV